MWRRLHTLGLELNTTQLVRFKKGYINDIYVYIWYYMIYDMWYTVIINMLRSQFLLLESSSRPHVLCFKFQYWSAISQTPRVPSSSWACLHLRAWNLVNSKSRSPSDLVLLLDPKTEIQSIDLFISLSTWADQRVKSRNPSVKPVC